MPKIIKIGSKRKCPICKGDFTVSAKYRKYCSLNCMTTANNRWAKKHL